MKRFRISLPLAVTVIVLTVVGAETYWCAVKRGQAMQAVAKLETLRRERDRLDQLSPLPEASNEAAAAEAVSEADRLLERIAGEPASAEEPAPTTVDEFLAITEFVGSARARMELAGIAIKPDERFGFSGYAQSGPEPKALPLVRRQRKVMEEIITILADVRPVVLLGIKRGQGENATGGGRAVGADDAFVLPGFLSLAQAGLFTTDAFRVEFAGQTATLRRFLNALVASSHRMVVRSVEAVPWENNEGRTRPGADLSPRPPIMKFTVTLETVAVAREENRS